MKIKLNKHKLDFEHTINYVQFHLDKVNTLSSQLINVLNLDDGYFFTLLPVNANLQKIYDFESGGILPQNSEIEYICDKIKSIYSIIPSIDNDLSYLITDQITSSNSISCIFDDVNSDFNGVDTYELFVNHGLHLENEIYYFLDKNNISIDLVKTCLSNSNAFWHSLCVFTTINLNKINKKLDSEDVKEICLTTELCMIGAYDSEAYVFWEKKNSSFFE